MTSDKRSHFVLSENIAGMKTQVRRDSFGWDLRADSRQIAGNPLPAGMAHQKIAQISAVAGANIDDDAAFR